MWCGSGRGARFAQIGEHPLHFYHSRGLPHRLRPPSPVESRFPGGEDGLVAGGANLLAPGWLRLGRGRGPLPRPTFDPLPDIHGPAIPHR